MTKKGIEGPAHGQSSNGPLGGGVIRSTIIRLSVHDQSTGGWVLSKTKTQASVNEQAAEEVVVQSCQVLGDSGFWKRYHLTNTAAVKLSD